MPALVDYPNVLKIRFHFVVGVDTNVVTAVHFTYTGTAPSNATCVAMATAIMGYFVTTCTNLMSDGVSITAVSVQDLTSPTAGFGEFFQTTVGTRGTDVLPAGVAALQNFPILRRYRGGKPRVYWPFGAAHDLLTASQWNNTFISNFDAGTGGLYVGITSSGSGGTVISTLVSISYYEGFTSVQNPITLRWRNVPKPRTVAIAPDVIQSIPLNPKPGSQRRRNLHSA